VVLNVPTPLLAFISSNENETLLLELVYLCVFLYLCVYVCMYVCTYVCIYVCTHVCVCVCVCMYVCTKVFIYALFNVAASSQVPAGSSNWPIS